MSEIIYLDQEDIRDIHNDAIILFGGLSGEHESGMIDFMAEKPQSVVFDYERYPDLFMKAAVYLEGFATHQYFVDGNKRTGVACTITFLLLNGYRLIISQNLLYTVAMRTAKKRLSFDTLVEILRRNSIHKSEIL